MCVVLKRPNLYCYNISCVIFGLNIQQQKKNCYYKYFKLYKLIF